MLLPLGEHRVCTNQCYCTNRELYYNDYSMADPEKRAGVVKMVKQLQKDGVPVHGIGMQGHINPLVSR